MFGNDTDANSSPSNNTNNSSAEYLNRAAEACAAGDVVLGLHLYLAAYERSMRDSSIPETAVIDGLRCAWTLACQHKERSLAEYIFEKLEPYLSADEIAQHAAQLQRLALDKLEEFGLTREDLEDMTEMISQDFFGFDPSTLFMRMEHGMVPLNAPGPLHKGLIRHQGNEGLDEGPAGQEASAESPEAEGHADKQDEGAPAAAPQGQGAPGEAPDAAGHPEDGSEDGGLQKGAERDGTRPAKDRSFEQALPKPFSLLLPEGAESTALDTPADRMTYKDLIGFEAAIDIMHGYGIGMKDDPGFKELVQTLNVRHGLDKMPATDTFLFRSPVREDANQFMVATMGEIDLPAIRMRMEENLQGMPVLCVMASTDNHPRLNSARNAIEGGGVLLLEDIDLWGSPLADASSAADEMGSFMQAQLSRGAREAINLIRSAVENPDVYVLVSAAQEGSIDGFFFDLLEPLTLVDIASPNAAERADLWIHIAREHPSLRTIDRAALVKYSAGMSRFDIYMAAREAVEDAYKASLVARHFIPVTSENIFEKIALYQPLDSDEYRLLENAVIDGFKSELDHLDDILKGTEGA